MFRRERFMTKNLSRARPLVMTVGLTGLLATHTVSACSAESVGGGGDSDTSAGGSSSNVGGSSGTMSSSGQSGDSTDAMGGTNATGGAAGEAGGDSGGTAGAQGGTTGATAGMGGSSDPTGGAHSGGSGTGGAGPGGSGAGGQGGSAGGGAAGMTGTLGERCSPRGALACAGNHQKVTLLCSGDDTWQPNQTCGTDQFCDSTPGPNVGTCRPVASGCEDGPGRTFCSADEKQLVTCGPDAVSATTTACNGACRDAECRDDVGDCPAWDDYVDREACASDCGTPEGSTCSIDMNGCHYPVVYRFPAVVRTPWADEACGCSTGRTMTATILWDNFSPSYVRVTAPSPWGFGGCGETRTACVVVAPTPNVTELELSTDTDTGPVNILFEGFDTEPTCPQ
jgi:hypothetical protein